MQPDVALIGLLRGGTNLGLGVILISVCQPVLEVHLEPHFFGFRPVALLLEILAFFQALFFRFGYKICKAVRSSCRYQTYPFSKLLSETSCICTPPNSLVHFAFKLFFYVLPYLG